MSHPSDVSRRRFIKTSSLALAGAVTIRDVPYIITNPASPDDPIRVGIIGCG
ncbi:MAG: twin-arginine translocation signal domain-containing protein, partial [Bacteroidota bacterium]